jgi:hypothetical protein
VRDNKAAGVVEPAMSKIKQIKLATEAAITILRIDDFIKIDVSASFCFDVSPSAVVCWSSAHSKVPVSPCTCRSLYCQAEQKGDDHSYHDAVAAGELDG